MAFSKIEDAKQRYAEWGASIGISTIEDLNKTLDEGKGIELINICEAHQERKYAAVANKIYLRKGEARIVMISGPSSSGKTSSSLRIAQQCKVLGLNPKVIELDNYFVDRDRTPLDDNGNPDFESLYAMDLEMLNDHLNALLRGDIVEIPHFDFKSGTHRFDGNFIKLEENDILVMEGIHALNPEMTSSVDSSRIFKVYVSALSALKVGKDGKSNSSTDKRLLRRIVRDNRTRGIDPERNILLWPNVRRGEHNNIFPYEENADVVFNSSMLYDLPMLRYFAEPLLLGIAESSPAYETAQRLLARVEMVRPLKPAEIAAIPPTSIMREFIGGQTL